MQACRDSAIQRMKDYTGASMQRLGNTKDEGLHRCKHTETREYKDVGIQRRRTKEVEKYRGRRIGK